MADEQSVDKSQLKQYLVPAVGLAAVVVLVGLVLSFSGVDERKMSDGSNGSADDPGLKEISPGVKYRDIKEGKGDVCLPGAYMVTMNYTGWLTSGEVFDSTKKEGVKAIPAPATFELNGLIPGWKEGIPGMKAGGIRKLVISPDKGYGPTAYGKIPAGSVLIFEVELLSSVRPRRSPPNDTTKLSDGTAPGADDPQLKPLGTGGLKYRDIKEGDGAVCPEGATPFMDYTGWLLNGSVFDSSMRDGKKPLDMALSDLIKGWQEGVPGMKVGGIRKLVIPASLAYGDQVKPGIPANSTLVFEIELLGFK